MAIKRKAGGRITGLAADPKPTAAAEPVNTIFHETDTHNEYINNGTTWVLYRASSKTETLTGKTIDFDNNTAVNSGPYNYYLYKVGSTYRIRNNSTGAISNGTTLETVWQSILDLMNKKSMYVFPGAYSFASNGLTVNQFETYLYIDRGAIFTLPQGFTDSVFEITDGESHCILQGGTFTEAGTQQRLWNLVELHSTSGGLGVTGSYIAHMWVKFANRAIWLHTDNVAGAWINSNTFYDMHIDHCNVGIDFDHGAAALAMNDNSFNSCFIQCRTGETTHGIKNVTGRGNTFVDSKVWDPLSGMKTMNIKAEAIATTIIKGKIAYAGSTWFEDLSDSSIIIDQAVGGIRIGKKTNQLMLTGAHDGAWGTMSGVASTGEGLLSGVTGSGTPTQQTNYTDGNFIRYTSGAVAGDNAGFRHTQPIAYRGWQPYMKCTFRVNDISNCRLWIGWKANSTEPTGDTDLTAVEGFFVGFLAADTEFQRIRNDNVGAATITAITGATKDTNIHTFEILMGDVPGSGLCVSLNFDNLATLVSNTNIPAVGTALYPHFQIETSTTAAKILDRFAFDVRSGR